MGLPWGRKPSLLREFFQTYVNEGDAKKVEVPGAGQEVPADGGKNKGARKLVSRNPIAKSIIIEAIAACSRKSADHDQLWALDKLALKTQYQRWVCWRHPSKGPRGHFGIQGFARVVPKDPYSLGAECLVQSLSLCMTLQQDSTPRSFLSFRNAHRSFRLSSLAAPFRHGQNPRELPGKRIRPQIG